MCIGCYDLADDDWVPAVHAGEMLNVADPIAECLVKSLVSLGYLKERGGGVTVGSVKRVSVWQLREGLRLMRAG